MSFNSYQSPYLSKPTPTPSDSNLASNPSPYYQPSFPKAQTSKTPDFQTSSFNTPSSINGNYSNGASKFPASKFSTSNFEKKEESWKNSDMITAKSMVFMGNQNQSATSSLNKKTLGGLGKLSSMARTVANNIDDAADFDETKNSSPQPNSYNFQEEKSATFKKYGNTLGGQFSNPRTNQQKQPSVTSSMFFNVGQEKTSVYKSFINMGSNSYQSTQPKKAGGLDFLMKYKKQQQEKKQKQLNSFKANDERGYESPKISHNGHNGHVNPSQNVHHKLFHEYSAPDLGHTQKNHHYEPVKVPVGMKNEVGQQRVGSGQFDSPVHNTHGSSSQSPYNYSGLANPNNINNTNNPNPNSKYSSPQQAPNPTFMKKFNSDKVDYRYNPVKTYSSSESTSPTQQPHPHSSFQKTLAFAKKDNKFGEDFISSPEDATTPNKDSKFMSPSFFKNKTGKVSQVRTLETLPSPGSPKVREFNENDSPTMRSTVSDEGSNGSLEYLDGDFSSDQPKEWSLEDFQLGDKLGKGAFGDVFVAREKNLGFMCVLKKMSKKRIKDLQRQQHVIRELKIQLYLNHTHLTSMYGYFHDKDYIYLILQYLSDGNLSQIKKRKKTSQKQTADIIKQVCQGLAFMHKYDIIHRDIKPENIFCNEGYVKLGDFGCSVFTNGMRKTVVSCLEYSSPEQLNGGCYNEKIDVWGIGILAYQLLTGRSPYEKEIMNMANEQVDFASLKFPEQLKISQLAKDFITSLLNVDPIDRLDIDEALEHRFITSNFVEMVELK